VSETELTGQITIPEEQPPRIGRPGLWLALGAALALKLWLLLSGAIPLHADEAMHYLMARHILQGEWPIFYYGQHYMGALDAYFVAALFAVLPPTLFVARLAALGLHLAVVGTTYALTWRLSRARFAAAAAALLVAVPPVMVALYTSISIGAYMEILLLNNLIWLLGWGILTGRRDGGGWWVLCGLLAGIGWWELPIILVSVLPLAALALWRFWRKIPWLKLGLLAGAFVVGALPWLIALVDAPGAVLADTTGIRPAAAGREPVDWWARVLSPLLFQLPALVGLRPSWALTWNLPLAGVFILLIELAALSWALRTVLRRKEPDALRLGLALLAGAWVVVIAALLGSGFGIDPSGRYMLVLYPPLAVFVGLWLDRVNRSLVGGRMPASRSGAPIFLALLLAYQFYGTAAAAFDRPRGLSTQLDPDTDLPPEYDDDLIAFLDSLGIDRGYGNYWIMGRLAWVTQERIIIAAALPFHDDLSYNVRDNRYPPYMEAVQTAERVVYITASQPELDRAIRSRLTERGLDFAEQTIGVYTVFYGLPYPIAPEELGPFGAVLGETTDR
jgi:hypothetical protein